MSDLQQGRDVSLALLFVLGFGFQGVNKMQICRYFAPVSKLCCVWLQIFPSVKWKKSSCSIWTKFSASHHEIDLSIIGTSLELILKIESLSKGEIASVITLRFHLLKEVSDKRKKVLSLTLSSSRCTKQEGVLAF